MTMLQARRRFRQYREYGGAYPFRAWARHYASGWAAMGERPTGKLERIWKGASMAAGMLESR